MLKMKTLLSASALAGGLVLAAAGGANAAPLSQFSFSSQPGMPLIFNAGGSFEFGDVDIVGNDLEVDLQTGGTGALVGLDGDIGGTFYFDNPNGANSVRVTGEGTFFLGDNPDDGIVGKQFSGSIKFMELREVAGPFAGILGTVVLDGGTYGGDNEDLNALAGTTGTISISFQVANGNIDLDDLYNNGGEFSYSGSITSVPEPASLALLGAGLLGAGLIRRRAK